MFRILRNKKCSPRRDHIDDIIMMNMNEIHTKNNRIENMKMIDMKKLFEERKWMVSKSRYIVINNEYISEYEALENMKKYFEKNNLTRTEMKKLKDMITILSKDDNIIYESEKIKKYNKFMDNINLVIFVTILIVFVKIFF